MHLVRPLMSPGWRQESWCDLSHSYVHASCWREGDSSMTNGRDCFSRYHVVTSSSSPTLDPRVRHIRHLSSPSTRRPLTVCTAARPRAKSRLMSLMVAGKLISWRKGSHLLIYDNITYRHCLITHWNNAINIRSLPTAINFRIKQCSIYCFHIIYFTQHF